MNKLAKYIKILKSKSEFSAFYEASQSMLQASKMAEILYEDETVIYNTSSVVVGPILSAYVFWILKLSIKKGISDLYFLARDGEILKEIAEAFISKYKLPIKSHYLYVSRYSLRKALFCVNEKENIEVLCRNSIHVTPKIIMSRTGLLSTIQEEVLLDIGYTTPKLQNTELTHEGLKKISDQLSSSKKFVEAMRELSKHESYKIFKYFCQEGITTDANIALIDSGWTGSMQRSIRQILEYHHVNKKIEGFYFGISNPTKREDGVYNSFYFSEKDISKYIRFNNNLFECWCMAEHGMTTGYTFDSAGAIFPILKDNPIHWYTAFQQKCIKQYAEELLNNKLQFFLLSEKKMVQLVKPLIENFMLNPSCEEAKVYGKIPFCDDSSESYITNLAANLSRRDLFGNLTLIKILNKVFPLVKKPFKESGWKEGTIALLAPIPRILMKIDCNFSYIIKILMKAWL